jgi:hypothetical protein
MFPEKAFKWKENSSFSHFTDPSQHVYCFISSPAAANFLRQPLKPFRQSSGPWGHPQNRAVYSKCKGINYCSGHEHFTAINE